MGIWVVRAFAVSSLAAAAAVVIIQTARGWPTGPGGALAAGVNAAVAVTFIVVGWIVSERRRSNSIGPLLLAVGVLSACFMVVDLYLQLPEVLRQRPSPRLPAVLAATWLAIGTVIPGILAFVVLILFPDGRPPSPRWRWVIAAAVIAATLGVAGVILDPGPLPKAADYSSPWGIPGFSGRLLIVTSDALATGLVFAAAVALAVRWRRSGAVEHAQIKWVVAAASVLIALVIAGRDHDDPTADEFSWALGIVINVSWALVAVAIGIAILRYHLYAIDRIVSRTIAYGVVIGVLAVLFYAIVIVLSSLLASFAPSFAQGEAIAVAASTLVVFAAFQAMARPVRHRVDRRFNRAHYDAERTAAAFSVRLRDEVNLETVAADLDLTVKHAVDPTFSGLWIRGSTGRPS